MIVFSFRGEETHGQKIERLTKLTGLSVSQLLRSLVDAADVEPVATFRPTIKKNADTQGRAPAFDVSGRSGGIA